MSKADELRAKARHYRELARMLDDSTAATCRDLADRYDEEAAADDAGSQVPAPPPSGRA